MSIMLSADSVLDALQKARSTCAPEETTGLQEAEILILNMTNNELELRAEIEGRKLMDAHDIAAEMQREGC